MYSNNMELKELLLKSNVNEVADLLCKSNDNDIEKAIMDWGSDATGYSPVGDEEISPAKDFYQERKRNLPVLLSGSPDNLRLKTLATVYRDGPDGYRSLVDGIRREAREKRDSFLDPREDGIMSIDYDKVREAIDPRIRGYEDRQEYANLTSAPNRDNLDNAYADTEILRYSRAKNDWARKKMDGKGLFPNPQGQQIGGESGSWLSRVARALGI